MDHSLHENSFHAHTHHSHDLSNIRKNQKKALKAILAANIALVIAQVVGGFLFNSLALLANGIHVLGDVATLIIALVAANLLERPATERYSFGFQRAEVLAAQINGIILIVISIPIVIEAIIRLSHPSKVSGSGVAILGLVSLLVNTSAALVLAKVGNGSLNIRAVFIHMATDALGALGAAVAGIVIISYGFYFADPIASIIITALVFWTGWALLRDTTDVLLEAAPRAISSSKVADSLLALPFVNAVHHLHLWNLASNTPALSAHVVMQDETLHEAQFHVEEVKEMLLESFDIGHATIEIECHDCEIDTASKY